MLGLELEAMKNLVTNVLIGIYVPLSLIMSKKKKKTIYVIYQLNKWTYSHIIVSLMPWIVVLLAYV